MTAMVDSGSTANQLRNDYKPIPVLLTPSLRLYRKDGPKEGPELLITAETNLTLNTVIVPVFLFSQIALNPVYWV